MHYAHAWSKLFNQKFNSISIQFILRSSDPGGVLDSEDIEHVKVTSIYMQKKPQTSLR